MPAGSPRTIIVQPELVNCAAPNTTATSARAPKLVTEPRKIGDPPPAGVAVRLTTSTPLAVPGGADRLTAHPPIANGCVYVDPVGGASIDMKSTGIAATAAPTSMRGLV